MNVFGRSSQPMRQSQDMEDRVAELIGQGYSQDEALDIAEQEGYEL